MTDNEFWIAVWRGIMAMLCIIVATIGGCDAYQNKLVADLVMHGTDPVAARCAIVGSVGEAGTTILCMKAGEKK